MRALISNILAWFFWRLFWMYLKRLACLHACKFKEAGSDFGYVHVHVLGRGGPGVRNPRGFTGLGHDDRTPNNSPHHNTVSRGGSCDFMRPGEVPRPQGPGGILFQGLGPNDAIAPIHLEAYSPFDIYLVPTEEDGTCPEGFWLIKCHCGNFCMTLDRSAWERWQRQWLADQEEGGDEDDGAEGSGGENEDGADSQDGDANEGGG